MYQDLSNQSRKYLEIKRKRQKQTFGMVVLSLAMCLFVSQMMMRGANAMTAQCGMDEQVHIETCYDNDAHEVTWNLGEEYKLANSTTYTVIFTVWPSQEVYDLVSDLNNKIISYDSLAEEQKSQLYIDENGVYYLKTNSHAKLGYTSLSKSEENDQLDVVEKTVTGLDIPDPGATMPLDGTLVKIAKEWKDDLDPQQLNDLLTEHLNEEKTKTGYSVHLHLWEDVDAREIHTASEPNGFVYEPDVDIKDGKVVSSLWPEKTAHIAPGFMITETDENKGIYDNRYPRVSDGATTYIVLEPGHDYSLKEDDIDLHFELQERIYRPMVIDSVLKTVVFKDGQIVDGGLLAEINEAEEGFVKLKAVNELKSGINIQKDVVSDMDAKNLIEPDHDFFFKVHLQKSSTDTTPVYTGQANEGVSGSLGYRIYAMANIPSDAEATFDKTKYTRNGLEYNAIYDNGEISGYVARGSISESGEIVLPIKHSDYARIVNIPSGTYYTVEEVDIPDNYSILSKTNETGTIKANTNFDVVFTNKRYFHLNLLKIPVNASFAEGKSEQGLSGAVFVAYKQVNEEKKTLDLPVGKDTTVPVAIARNLKGEEIGEIVSNENGMASLGVLEEGTYYLKETTAPEGCTLPEYPVKVVVTEDNVMYDDGTQVSLSGDGAYFAKETQSYTLAIANEQNNGYALPESGGTGTAPFYAAGGTLLALCCILCLRRKTA